MSPFVSPAGKTIISGKISLDINSHIVIEDETPHNSHKTLEESKSLFKQISESLSKTFTFRLSEAKNNVKLKEVENSSPARGNLQALASELEDEEKKWGKYTGMLLALLSSLVFSISALLVKYLPNYNPITIALWRFQGALWPALPFFIHHQFFQTQNKSHINNCNTANNNAGDGESTLLRTKLKFFGLVMARSILSCNALLLNFYSLKYLDIGDALVISSSTPIFVTLVAHKFLDEKCGVVPFISAIFTLIGVMVISRPPHLTGEEEFDFDSMIGTGLAFGCMILATISYAILRYIRTLHFSVTAIGFGAWGTIENLVLALAFNVFSLPNGTQDWLLAGGLILLTFIGQLFVILAFKCEQAGFVALFKTSDVLFAFVWQILFLGRIPDRYSFIGSMIIVFCISLTAFRKWLSSLPANNLTRRRLSFLLL